MAGKKKSSNESTVHIICRITETEKEQSKQEGRSKDLVLNACRADIPEQLLPRKNRPASQR